MKTVILHTVAFIVFAPCILCVSEETSTIILGILYAFVLSTIIRSTRIGRKFLRCYWREILRLDNFLS